MTRRKLVVFGTIAAISWGLAIGCASRPGTGAQQGTLIEAAANSERAATLGEENRLFGVLIGGALGARGGYLIGADAAWFESPNRQKRAHDAVTNAENSPATVDEVHTSSTADLNLDGFVTTDELIAMERAGLSEDRMLARLHATHQIFDLSPSQRRAIGQAGVSQRVIRDLPDINRFERELVLGSTN